MSLPENRDEPAAHAAIEAVVRGSYGRLIAFLSARSGDVAGAEDAVSDAFLAALRSWPVEGVPSKPEAWLLHVARNRIVDASRRRQVREAAENLFLQAAEEAQTLAASSDDFPDERLKLLFVCAHPAIDVSARTPLMLQAVLGMDAARIASAFLTSPAAMAQRLVRAKNKVQAAGIPFVVPERPEWNERVSFVLDAIYAAYTTGWESLNEEGTTHQALASEAIALGRLLTRLLPEEPEAQGLLAMMLHCEARRPARFTREGEFVSLVEQSPELWDTVLIAEAEENLRRAAGNRQMGRYQLEAAIQSIHAHRLMSGRVDWAEILLLYEGLVRIAPGIGSLVGRAVALAEACSPAAGLAALDEMPAERLASYQPYWAVRGHLLHLLSRCEEACAAFTRAASLADDPALRVHLVKRSQSCIP